MKVKDLHKYTTMLLDLNPNNADLDVVVILNQLSQGPTASTRVKGITQGFDWNSGKVMISTEDEIIKK